MYIQSPPKGHMHGELGVRAVYLRQALTSVSRYTRIKYSLPRSLVNLAVKPKTLGDKFETTYHIYTHSLVPLLEIILSLQHSMEVMGIPANLGCRRKPQASKHPEEDAEVYGSAINSPWPLCPFALYLSLPCTRIF